METLLKRTEMVLDENEALRSHNQELHETLAKVQQQLQILSDSYSPCPYFTLDEETNTLVLQKSMNLKVSSADLTVQSGNIIIQGGTCKQGREGTGNFVMGYGHDYSQAQNSFFAGDSNTIKACAGAVLGGRGNLVTAEYSTTSGGPVRKSRNPALKSRNPPLKFRNPAPKENVNAKLVTVSEDMYSTPSASGAIIIGGNNNTASGAFSTMMGGSNNTASGAFAFVVAGTGSTASGAFSGVIGGLADHADGADSITIAQRDSIVIGDSIVVGTQPTNSTSTTTAACYDTDPNAKDKDGLNCENGYDPYPSWCHYHTEDDDDFTPAEMCCSCGGGSPTPPTTTTTTTTTLSLEERVSALEIEFDRSGVSWFQKADDKTLKLYSKNLWLVSSCSSSSECPSEGNLVVGLSHKWKDATNSIVVGESNTIAGKGNLVAGLFDESSSESQFSSILGGQNNKVVGKSGTVIGGSYNTVSKEVCVKSDHEFC